MTSATSLVVALSVWASLTSTTARKETRIAQKTATRIPATSPPDTLHRSLLVDALVVVCRSCRSAVRRRARSSVRQYRDGRRVRPYRAGQACPNRITVGRNGPAGSPSTAGGTRRC